MARSGWLQELPDDAEAERALELRPAGAERLEPGLARERARGGHERGLADARRPLDHERPAVAGSGVLGARPDR
jgi:hypothetical protein